LKESTREDVVLDETRIMKEKPDDEGIKYYV